MNARHYMDEYPTEMFRWLKINETTLDQDIADYNWKKSAKPSWQVYLDHMLEDAGSNDNPVEEVEVGGSDPDTGEQEDDANDA